MVALEGRGRAQLRHLRHSRVLKIHRRRAHDNQWCDSLMHLAQRLAGAAHLLDLSGGFDEDWHRCSKFPHGSKTNLAPANLGCYARRIRCSAASIAAVTASTGWSPLISSNLPAV